MRWALLVLVLALGALGYFFGLRFGYLSLTPAWMYNAQGLNTYSYRTYDDRGQVVLSGSCMTMSGQATLRLFSPSGQFVKGQACSKGKFSLNLNGGGEPGYYRLAVELNHFTGRLEVNEGRAGDN